MGKKMTSKEQAEERDQKKDPQQLSPQLMAKIKQKSTNNQAVIP